jgi:hypothetical protein
MPPWKTCTPCAPSNVPTFTSELVSLGADLSRVKVHARLRDAPSYCLSRLAPAVAGEQARALDE